jgi:uncharacterized membrane protein
MIIDWPFLAQLAHCVGLLSALGAALAAGVFFAFANFVMPALDRLSPGEAIAAMNSINAKAINPLFMTLLFGTGVLCAADIALAVRYWAPIGFETLVAGSVLYLISGVAVTMMRNVPLNIALSRVSPADPRSEEEWAHYSKAWARWNHVRTIGCAIAAGLIIEATLNALLWYWGIFIKV